ncbi:MAG: hypothetical protein J6B09_06515 [Clostridia bacterium]|nr:hypothetical protein [Clostridia bacterium]
MKQKLISLLALLLAALMLFSGCAAHGKTFIEAGSEDISINVFQLYLSRMKGTLAAAGHDVNNADFWATIEHLNGKDQTRSEYFTNQVLEGLKQIAAALCLYDELGLRLDPAVEDEIDLWIDELIEEVGEGSKSQFNSVLSAYGANITVLRDAAIIEAKLDQLRTELYGEDGSRIGPTKKEQFYKDNYYRGYQMLISNAYHDHDRDDDDRTVYYVANAEGNLIQGEDGSLVIAYDTTATPETKDGVTVYYKFGDIAYDVEQIPKTDANGNFVRDAEGNKIFVDEHGKVAYDKKNGRPATKKDGDQTVPEIDENGNTVYRKWVIAYDTKNGKPNYKYNAKGENLLANYTEDEMAKRLLKAEEIAKTCQGNTALFLEYMKAFGENQDFNNTYAPNGMYFTTGSYNADTIFSTFSVELAKMQVGDLMILNSSSGYYILMRSELDDGAWQQEANSRWFSSLTDLVIESTLQDKLKAEGYLDRIVVNEALLGTVDITMVAANNYY